MVANSPKGHLLVVDDSADTRELLQRKLSAQGYRVYLAVDVSEALRILSSERIDLVITDLKMPGASGLELVRYVRENLKETEVMMLTGYPSVEGAVEAIKSGAEEYLCKPFTSEELTAAVSRIMEKPALRKAGSSLVSKRGSNPLGMVGDSEVMQKLYKTIAKAASATSPIMIIGENGTGKELVARAVHYASTRAEAPFVTINCVGSPEELLERQFFGHIKEKPDGQRELQAGLLHFVDRGTLYLKEISELPLTIQTKLSKVLEEKKFKAVGSDEAFVADFLVIADTNRDLQPLVDEGLFHEGLFSRLSSGMIHVPALRDRGNDALILARYFLTKFAKELDKPVPRLSDRAAGILRAYRWPGNVAELHTLIQQLVAGTENEVIDAPDLLLTIRQGSLSSSDLNRTLAELEVEHIRNVIASVGGNKSRAAEILGINRKTLREKLRGKS